MTITLKNVPKPLHQKLKKRASLHKRSLNQEAIACLEETVGATRPVTIDELLGRFEKLRSRIKGPLLTEDFLEKAVNEGRA